MCVDDTIMTEENLEEIKRLKKILATKFEGKDFGNMYFLRMELARSKRRN